MIISHSKQKIRRLERIRNRYRDKLAYLRRKNHLREEGYGIAKSVRTAYAEQKTESHNKRIREENTSLMYQVLPGDVKEIQQPGPRTFLLDGIVYRLKRRHDKIRIYASKARRNSERARPYLAVRRRESYASYCEQDSGLHMKKEQTVIHGNIDDPGALSLQLRKAHQKLLGRKVRDSKQKMNGRNGHRQKKLTKPIEPIAQADAVKPNANGKQKRPDTHQHPSFTVPVVIRISKSPSAFEAFGATTAIVVGSISVTRTKPRV